jgi:hypothetical protein
MKRNYNVNYTICILPKPGPLARDTARARVAYHWHVTRSSYKQHGKAAQPLRCYITEIPTLVGTSNGPTSLLLVHGRSLSLFLTQCKFKFIYFFTVTGTVFELSHTSMTGSLYPSR